MEKLIELPLVSGLFGSIVRIAPELIRHFDKKNERAHELAMMEKSLELEKTKATRDYDMAVMSNKTSVSLAELQAIASSSASQSVMTGNRFIDGVNQLVRPAIAIWWCLVLYSAVLWSKFYMITGSNFDAQSIATAFTLIWGVPEQSIVYSIIGYLFVDRTLRHLQNAGRI